MPFLLVKSLLTSSVGHRSLGETFGGVVFTYDPTTSALVLEQRTGGIEPKARLRSTQYDFEAPCTASATDDLPDGGCPNAAGDLSGDQNKRCA